MPDEILDNATPAVPSVEPAPSAPAPTAEPTFTQAELNAKLATHKRSLQNDLAAANKKATAFDSLQTQVSELLDSGLLDGVENLADFQDAAALTINELRPDAERHEAETQKSQKALQIAQEAATTATTKFNQASINQSINDACPIGTKAVSAGALNLIKMHLGQFADVQADDSVTFTMDVADEDGNVSSQKLTAEKAVQLMESNVTEFGTLFKATVNGGGGGEIVDGVKRTPTGQIDVETLDMEKFIELESKNPGAVAASLMS